MPKRIPIFIFAYYSFKDPIFQSAVLPYLKNFGKEYEFIVLSFEQNQYRLSSSDFEKISNELKKDQIVLYRTNWNSGRFKLLKKMYDFLKGLIISQYLIKKHGTKLVYSEGFPGCIMGHYLAKVNRLPHFIHSFEPHAQYMLEAKVWSKKSWEYKLLKKIELNVAKGAHTIFTATEAYRELLIGENIKSNIIQVPSCVDTHFFEFNSKKRKEKRGLLNYKEDDIVICYLGKFGGMYMDEELFDFYKLCLEVSSKFKLLVISVDNSEHIIKLAKQADISLEQINLLKLTRDEIPAYLSASDWGFIGVKPLPSKRYCSPIKTGEYWAAGLPVITPDGISDDFELVEQYNLGITFKIIDFNLAKKTYYNSNLYSKETLKSFCFNNRDASVYKNYLRNAFNKVLPQS